MIVNTKAKNELIKFNLSNGFSQEEYLFLVNSIKDAYLIIDYALNQLKSADEKTQSFIDAIYQGETSSAEIETILKKILSKIKIGKLNFLREKFFDEDKDVFSSVSKDTNFVIKIYNPFFDIKQFKDDRAGVIIHEVAHLSGLEGEKNLEEDENNDSNQPDLSLESAEAIKNFCLLCSDRITLKQIESEKDETEIEDDKNSDETNADAEELTYSPDQPRAPKGQSNGGQWVGGNGGGSSTPSNSKKKSSPDKKEQDSSKNPKGIEKGNINDSIKPNGELANKKAKEAKDLLFGTVATESDLKSRIQDRAGPALGITQMEYETFRNIIANDAQHPLVPSALKAIENEFNNGKKLQFEDLIKNDKIAIAIARLKYLPGKGDLDGKDLKGLAKYWKKNYNSSGGAGTEQKFIDKFTKYKSMITNDKNR